MNANEELQPGSNSVAPHVVHVIYRLNIGGLENGLVNLINQMPEDQYRHSIVCLTDYTEFSRRITRDVTLYSLDKKEGKDFAIYYRLWKLFRKIRPDIVHTRNIATLEAAVIARLAGVHACVHGEHGRDSYDIDGSNRKYKMLRRMTQAFVHRYIALSKDLEQWLKEDVGISAAKVVQIYNGVDTVRFSPGQMQAPALPPGFTDKKYFIIGTVGRIQEIKDQLTLINAFARLIEAEPVLRESIRLVVIGDGPMMGQARLLVEQLDLDDVVWLSGARDDIPQLLGSMDLFVLPSRAEGVSNTILEAMSCGLPVVATDVGGNSELVIEGSTGTLVPAQDIDAMASALRGYYADNELLHRHGEAGRQRIASTFSMNAMVDRYMSVYAELQQ